MITMHTTKLSHLILFLLFSLLAMRAATATKLKIHIYVVNKDQLELSFTMINQLHMIKY
jgi:hypothetical protein